MTNLLHAPTHEMDLAVLGLEDRDRGLAVGLPAVEDHLGIRKGPVVVGDVSELGALIPDDAVNARRTVHASLLGADQSPTLFGVSAFLDVTATNQNQSQEHSLHWSIVDPESHLRKMNARSANVIR